MPGTSLLAPQPTSSSPSSIFATDVLLSHVSLETSTLLFNLASLYYTSKQNECSRQILDCLFERLDISPLEKGLSIKICFLYIEVLLRIWYESGGAYFFHQRINFQQVALKIFTFLDRYCYAYSGGVKIDEDTGSSSIESSQTLMGHVLTFRVLIYRARVGIALNSLNNSSLDLQSAIEIYKHQLQNIVQQPSLRSVDMAVDLALQTYVGNVTTNVTLTNPLSEEKEFAFQLQRQWLLAINVQVLIRIKCLVFQFNLLSIFLIGFTRQLNVKTGTT